MVQGSNPSGGEIFCTYPDRPCGPPSLLYNGYWILPGGKGGRGVTLTTHPHLVPRSWKSMAIPLLPLWASVACYRVKLQLTLPKSDKTNLSGTKKLNRNYIYTKIMWNKLQFHWVLGKNKMWSTCYTWFSYKNSLRTYINTYTNCNEPHTNIKFT
jgi:hypothetical protein